eukprot:Gb_06749 [translate_table: standard]
MPPTNSSTPRVILDPVTWDPKVSYDAPQSITPTLGLQSQVMTPPHLLSLEEKQALHLQVFHSRGIVYRANSSPEPRQSLTEIITEELPSNITSPLYESSDSGSPLLVAITGNIPHVDTSQHVPLPSPPVISLDNSISTSEFLPELIPSPVSQPISIGLSTSGLQNNSANPPPTLEHTPLEQTLPPSQIMPFDPLSLNSSSVCNHTDTNLTNVPPKEHPSSFSLLVTTPPTKTSLNNDSSPSLPCKEDPPVTNPHSGNYSPPPCDSPSCVSSHECLPPVCDIPPSVCDSLPSTSSSKCPITSISLPFTNKTPAFDMPSSSANQQTWPKFDLVDLFTTNLPEDIKKIVLAKTCYKHFLYYLSLFIKSCSQSEWCREDSWNLSSSAPCLYVTVDPKNKVTILSLSSAWTIQDYLTARILLKIDLLNYVDFATKDLHQASGWFLLWLHQISAAPEWWKLLLTDASYYSFYISAKTDAFQNYIWDDGG